MNSHPTISSFSYQGSLHVPFSKSYLQRAIAVAVLSRSLVKINGYTSSKDAVAAISIAEALGANCVIHGTELLLNAREVVPQESVTIHCGEAGLSTRMFSPIAASLASKVTVEGEGSILVRPMDMVIDALEKLGAEVRSNEGKLPLQIRGGIRSGKLRIDASESSQLLTGLLIALSNLEGESTILVDEVKSIPYIQMTLDILSDFGIRIEHDAYQTYRISATKKWSAPEAYFVEGDWSGASFHIVGAAISGSVRLEGLQPNSAQADRAILEALQSCGAFVEWREKSLFIRSEQRNAFEFDATHCPDLFPPLAALAANCSGISRIYGVSRLAHKESNRALTIQSELKKIGIRVALDGDEMRIFGGEITGGTIDSHNDHRIAMMGAILAMTSKAPITILNSKAVAKSYPDFFSDLSSLSKKD